MPMYTWKNEETDAEITVIRKVDDIERQPTEEELREAGCLDADIVGPWRRVMCATQFTRGAGWRGRKGYW